MFRSEVLLFDAIHVVILMEHTMHTDLFQDHPYPVVMDEEAYEGAKEEVLTGLGLDPSEFKRDKKSFATPSPLKRIEEINQLFREAEGAELTLSFENSLNVGRGSQDATSVIM